jgi:GTP pyrophosphokinase
MSARLEEAIRLAAELHRGQTRKGGDVPYVLHPLAVAALVAEHGGSEDEIVAAVLHDAVEDGGGAPVRRRLRERFGDRVAAIVDGCTDTDRVPKPPWRERKEAFVRRLRDADASVKLVVAADKLHNATATRRDLEAAGDAVWSRFRGGRDGTLWYYRAVREALGAGWDSPLLAELDREIGALARY